LKLNTTKIYTSKLANVPTPGYSGHTSIFIKPVSYLNRDKILQDEIDKKLKDEIDSKKYDDLAGSFKSIVKLDPETVAEVNKINFISIL
jgi:hypothetical protein